MPRFEFHINEAPKSLNAGGNGSRRHWAVGYREKARWEGLYLVELLAARVPKAMVWCKADAVIKWRRRARRDEENYRGPISKPLADALVKGGYLPDDTSEFFRMGELRFVIDPLNDCSPLVKAQLVVTLEAHYA